jgi:hypothetical protein
MPGYFAKSPVLVEVVVVICADTGQQVARWLRNGSDK